MKLILAVVQGKDADGLLAALLEHQFRVTQINSAGGFLREGNATFMIGVEDDVAEDVLRVVKQNCYTRTQYVNPLLPIIEPGDFSMASPVEVQVGGAAVFIVNVSRYERIMPLREAAASREH
jgi:uncharacterized protein YaaQ